MKTARRDLEALAIAGIPVYSQPGKGGGWSLLGGARTDLSGLTADRGPHAVHVAGPSSTATPEAKAALRKLVQALPGDVPRRRRGGGLGRRPRPGRVGRHGGAPTRRTSTCCSRPSSTACRSASATPTARAAETERVVHPLGLVEKDSHLVPRRPTPTTGMRTFRVNRVRAVERTGEPVVRPPDFDLAATWDTVVGDDRGAPDARPGPSCARRAWCRYGLRARSSDRARDVVAELDDGRVEVEVGAPTEDAWPSSSPAGATCSRSSSRRGPRPAGRRSAAELVARYGRITTMTDVTPTSSSPRAEPLRMSPVPDRFDDASDAVLALAIARYDQSGAGRGVPAPRRGGVRARSPAAGGTRPGRGDRPGGLPPAVERPGPIRPRTRHHAQLPPHPDPRPIRRPAARRRVPPCPGGARRPAHGRGGLDIEREVWDLTTAEHVRESLAALPAEERTAIELAYCGGLHVPRGGGAARPAGGHDQEPDPQPAQAPAARPRRAPASRREVVGR